MDFVIRFMHVHETFRLAEIQALAELAKVELKVISYSLDSPFCLVQLESEDAARRLVKRSILGKAIYELWGQGDSYEALHANIKERTESQWEAYKTDSFKFMFDSFQGTRSPSEQRDLIDTFRYLAFEGPIRMKGAKNEFAILEQWPRPQVPRDPNVKPNHLWFGKLVGTSERDVVAKYDLKKRKYISTTSMDSELALVTANIAQAAPGKLFYDPFVGTGSFPIACAHFGALAFGSDIDGRSIRGKGNANLIGNFKQYGIMNYFGDAFVADLTNTPLRAARLFDGIICDPPYGVREGLKVLGSRDVNKGKEVVYNNGVPHHLEEGYIPPKKPYSFHAMLDDIVDFAAMMLVPNGHLSFWMPTSNAPEGSTEEEQQAQQIAPPDHPCLELTSVCTQQFNRWARKLITYRRRADDEVDEAAVLGRVRARFEGVSADELNPFRKLYFQGFKPERT